MQLHHGDHIRVGGGELENRVIGEAIQALKDGAPRLIEYSMADPQRGDPGVCGGQLEVFVEPLMPKPLIVVIGAGHAGCEAALASARMGRKTALVTLKRDAVARMVVLLLGIFVTLCFAVLHSLHTA